MTEPLRPSATSVHGRENWLFVPTLADAAAPTVAEVTAAGGLDITRIVFADSGKPSQSTNRVTQQRRLGDTTVPEFIGDTSYTGGDMTYALDPQAAAGADGKKLWELIPEGTTGYLVRRLGVPRATDPTAGQFVDVYPVAFGPSMPTTAGDAESAEAAAMVTFAVTDKPEFVVAIAA